MITMPKNQRMWLTPQHRLLTKIDFFSSIQQNNIRLKFKQKSQINLRFLDEVAWGETPNSVIQKLGDPFFIHKNPNNNESLSIFTYVFRSANRKLKIQLHFIDNTFSLGTIVYNAPVNCLELNYYFRNKYQLRSFDILRDMIADNEGNLINFLLNPDQLVILFYNQ